MKHIEYKTSGVCTSLITFDIDENDCVHNIAFTGGCSGNLTAISRLLEGMDRSKIIGLLSGNRCGPRSTSCADQLTKALSSVK